LGLSGPCAAVVQRAHAVGCATRCFDDHLSVFNSCGFGTKQRTIRRRPGTKPYCIAPLLRRLCYRLLSGFSPSYGELGSGMLARSYSRRSPQEIKCKVGTPSSYLGTAHPSGRWTLATKTQNVRLRTRIALRTTYRFDTRQRTKASSDSSYVISYLITAIGPGLRDCVTAGPTANLTYQPS
jgi:hypothetical protein